jgi:hypothetical protein
MTSALGKAGAAVKGLRVADPGGFDLGDPTVAAAASDLFIGLHAFGQGLGVGIAHCEKSVTSSRDSIAAIDRQLEAAAAATAPGKSSPVKRLPVTAGAAPGGVTAGGVTVTKVDLDSLGGTNRHKTTWSGTKSENKTETKSNALTGEQKTTHTKTASDGSTSSTTVEGGHHDQGGER